MKRLLFASVMALGALFICPSAHADGDPICHSEISPDGSMPLCNSCRNAIHNPNLAQQVAFDCGVGGGVNLTGGKPHCKVGGVSTGRIPPACDGDLQENGSVTPTQ
ncbi:hypothetical protein GCM10009641_83640 [Mycobacterium cookii]|uniref:Uncharacterized protein n=1 Tax=Mycobacterium cookii TaxID=1775 RepID=A0A7I7KRI6_9MYCO|nr:hypothetical protein MCOO_03890 [Mycobacterium cookii]